MVSQREKLSQDAEEVAMTMVQIASASLFTLWIHTKSLPGNATNRYEILSQHIQCFIATMATFSQLSRFCEFLLECVDEASCLQADWEMPFALIRPSPTPAKDLYELLR